MTRDREFVDAARSMLDELVRGGIDRGHAYACVMLYSIALSAREEPPWARFYRAVALELCHAAERGPLPPGAAALRTLLEDDFGARILEPELRKRVDSAFVERNLREASLPS